MTGAALKMIILFGVAMGLSACQSGFTREQAIDPYALQAEAREDASSPAYRIGETDLLRIDVFRVAELSFDEIRVDASGAIQMPLIGAVQAAGLTPAELSAELSRRLGERYLRDPYVTVAVVEAASQKVTVDGAVTKPGVYLMRGRTTLLQAVAMAEGPVRAADVRNVAIFRDTPQGRMVGVFDLEAIRLGRADDPVIQGDDVIVVDTSRLQLFLRDVISVLPAVGGLFYAIDR